jgi:hypothetical protein
MLDPGGPTEGPVGLLGDSRHATSVLTVHAMLGTHWARSKSLPEEEEKNEEV